MGDHKRRSYKSLTLSQLRSFCEVCRQGGYAAAARELLLTGPAVWEQIHALEHHYGTRLLDRQGNVMRATPEGERLLELLRPLLAGLDSTKEVLRQEDGALPKQVTLGTNLRVLNEEVSRSLHRFQCRYPQIRLRLLYTGNDVDQRILTSEADVGFTLEPGPDMPCSPAVVYEPAGEVDYLLVTRPRHPLLRLRSLTLRHLVPYPLVLGEPAAYSRRRVQEILHRHDLTQALSVAVETSSDEYTLSCVRAGLGVGITIGTGKGHLYQGLGVRSLRRWFGTARVGFLWKRGASVPPVQRQLAQALRACVSEK
jgi:DNA-binding transcriptional LysR family regulator